MTPLLNMIFECILDPNHKVNVVKGEIKEKGTYLKTASDLATGKEKHAFDAYFKNKAKINKDVDEAFKEVKFPW